MQPGMDPVRPDDIDTPASPAPKQMCIISGDPLRPRAFMAALDPALRANEELTIIVDRRRGGAGNAADRPRIERRRHPSVDAKVKTDGFAIVPLSSDDPPWIERFSDRQSPDDDADAGERAIQRILEFKRRRRVRVGPLLGVSAVVGAFIVLVVVFVQMPGGQAIVGRSRPAAIPSAEPPASVQAPAVRAPSLIETSAPPPRTSPSPPRAERVGRPRDATRARTEAVSPPPRPQPSVSPQSERGRSSSEPVSASRGEATSELPDAQPASAPAAAPPPRPRTITPSQPAAPAASAPEPPRPHEPSPASRSRTAATPGDSPARSSSAPTPPSFKSSMKDLETVVTRDMIDAGIEAQRVFGEVKSKTIEKFDEMRRVWKRSFTDRPSDEAAAARARR